MGKGVKIGVIIVVIAVVAGGIAWALGNNSDNNMQTNNSESSNEANRNETTTQNDDEPIAATITYTSSGFEPTETTVKSGDKIKIVNESGNPLEFSSDPHPSHTINPELNAGDTEEGQSTTIIVTKTGKWGVHNHYNPNDRATVIVE